MEASEQQKHVFELEGSRVPFYLPKKGAGTTEEGETVTTNTRM